MEIEKLSTSELIDQLIDLRLDQAIENHVDREHDGSGIRLGDSRPDLIDQIKAEIARRLGH